MKKRLILWGSVIVVGIGVFFGWRYVQSKSQTSGTLETFTEVSPYDNTQLKADAEKRLSEGIEPSEVISDDAAIDKYLGLSFQGLSDSVTNQKIIALLQKYNRRATFFVPGIQAAESRDDVLDMVKNGNTIGSNTLKATPHLEDSSSEELINDFTAANCVVTAITGEKNPMLQCNATSYTEELLKIANACGNEKVVPSSHMINYQSFTSYEQIYNYLNKLPKGSILTIKITGVLDAIELEDQEVDERPAEDMQPTLDPEEQAFIELPEEDRIVQITEWLLMAMDETNYQTKALSDFTSTATGDRSMVFDDAQELLNSKGAVVYPYIPMEKNLAGMQIRGISDGTKVDALLQKLGETEQTATFYVTTEEIDQYPERIRQIIDAGCSVENGGASDEIITDRTTAEVSAMIQECNSRLRDKFQIESRFFMPAGGRYDEAVKTAATDNHMTMVTYSKRPMEREGTALEDILQTFRRTLSKGSLVYLNLDTFENVTELADGVIDMIVDKKYKTVDIATLYADKGSDEELSAFSIPVSLSEGEIAKLRKNGQSEAATRQIIYTTERAVAFSFSGIANGSAVDQVLQSMAVMGAKGTFFVTYQEMKTYPGRVKEILRQGHEIGIGMVANDKTTFASACNEIAAARNYMEYNNHVTPDMAMCPISRTKNEKAISEMKKAIRAMDCTLVGSSVSITQSALKGVITAPEYYAALSKSKFRIQMGQIVYTRLDYLDNSDILGEVLLRLKQDKIDPIAYYDPKLNAYMWQYAIKPVGDVVHNTADNGARLYNLNSPEGAGNIINLARVGFADNDQFISTVVGGYIGNPDVGDKTGLVSFTDQEILRLDKTGKMPGNIGDNQVFLSFDDWGTDISLNHLLYVLNKYQIKATFFIRTNNVASNPNLLRAIAVEGHEIGSHTASHFRLSNEVDTGVEGTYDNSTLTDEEALQLRYDVVKSYEDLYRIIGDVSVNGHPALVPIFRPPTLAVSRIGLQQIFETGYQYSVSGDFSTQDYTYQKAEGGVDKLTNVFMNGYSYWGGTRTIQSHSIVVMHMSENADSTAEAIENWMEKGARSKFNFTIPIYQYLTR